MNKELIINEIADYIISTNSTIRKAAISFNISKSTVHNYLQKELINIDVNKYKKVKQIMEEHIKTRHIKGGESTRKLFLEKKKLTL